MRFLHIHEERAGLTTLGEKGFWLRRVDLTREICSNIFASRALNRSEMVKAAPGRRVLIVAAGGQNYPVLTCGSLAACSYMEAVLLVKYAPGIGQRVLSNLHPTVTPVIVTSSAVPRADASQYFCC